MPFTSTKDTEIGDCYFDISKTDKRLIRATVKTYERTGTYVFLNLFKKGENAYEFQQRVSLTVQEFENLIEKSGDMPSNIPSRIRMLMLQDSCKRMLILQDLTRILQD